MLDLHEYVKTRKGARQFAEVKTKYHNFDLDRYNRDTQFLLLVGNGRSMIEAYEACNNIDENPDTVAEIIESEIYDAEDLEPEPKESEVKYVGKKPIREMQTQNCLITLIIEGIAIFIFPVWMSGFRIALFDLTGLIPILLGIEFLYIRKEMPLIKKVFVTLPKWLMILAIISELPDIAAILIISWTVINNLFWIVYAIVTLIKYIKNSKYSNSNRIREHFNASASNANVPGSTHISFSQKAKDVFTTFTGGAMFI